MHRNRLSLRGRSHATVLTAVYSRKCSRRELARFLRSEQEVRRFATSI